MSHRGATRMDLRRRVTTMAKEIQRMEQRQLWAARVIYTESLFNGSTGTRVSLGPGGWRISASFTIRQSTFSSESQIASVAVVTTEGVVGAKSVYALAGTYGTSPGAVEMEFWLRQNGDVWVELATDNHVFVGGVHAAIEAI